MLPSSARVEKLPLFERVTPKIYTVTEIATRVRELLESQIGSVWIEGEISNLRVPASGHCYFSLKDPRSQIRVVLWRGTYKSLRFDLKDGLEVILHGALSAYEPRSEYQIIGDGVEPKGLGALQLAFEQLKEKLAKEGLFDPKHKKPIPMLPERIGIVTSPTGAAVRDMLNVIHRRFANVVITIAPVRVQGEGSAQEIASAICDFNQWGKVDVIVLARGGGSLEDLWAFNEEVMARAIFASKIPVISAVGHEIDFTIADFVADLRAPTPSAAAELVVQNKIDLIHQIEHYRVRLLQSVRAEIDRKRGAFLHWVRGVSSPERIILDQSRRIDELTERLRLVATQDLRQRQEKVLALTRSLRLLNPVVRLNQAKQFSAEWSKRLVPMIRIRMEDSRKRVESVAGKLQALSPLAVLERGYSIVWKLESEKILKTTGQMHEGDEVRIRLHQGTFEARVGRIEKT
jgi:exodeoxyribonuclease VII large subunit